MRILLIGGHSAMAQALLPLLQDFAEVITAGRHECDVALDLSWPVERFNIPDGIDVAINLVAHFGGDSYDDFLSSITVNTLGALKVCLALQRAGINRLVHISSMSACLSEYSKYHGIYALTKKQADDVIQLFCLTHKMSYAILRPSQLYGDQDAFRKHQPFLYSALDKALRNEDVSVYGRHDALRNYVHAEDFGRVVCAVIRQRVEGVYQCTTDKNVSLGAVARAFISAARSSSKVLLDGTKEDIPDNIFPYDDSLYRKIQTYPVMGIEAGAARLVAARLEGL